MKVALERGVERRRGSEEVGRRRERDKGAIARLHTISRDRRQGENEREKVKHENLEREKERERQRIREMEKE